MTSMFSGSTCQHQYRCCRIDEVIGSRTLGASPGFPEPCHERLQIFEAEMLFMESLPIEGLAEAPVHVGV